MIQDPIYCDRCGAILVSREIEGRPRAVCPACHFVHYRNPLPVAAAVVLNDERQVLLVKRLNEPHRRMWCLPTGFAESGETIAEAALRELKEETALTGRVIRLLSADSNADNYYGDLLFVIFEVEKMDGVATAGDDAEAIEWFPLNALPELAFAPHREAAEICARLHREEWAIQDSFQRLHDEKEAEVLSDALLELVRDKAEEISFNWLLSVRGNPSTPNYGEIEEWKIRERALEALTRFQYWLGTDGEDRELAEFYFALGRERREQGFSTAEVISALTLLRREFWNFARHHQVLESPMDVYRVMELSRRVVLFFDKAIYHASKGLET